MTADLEQLNRLLQLIEQHIDLDHCKEVDDRYTHALAGEATDWTPLVVQVEWAGDNWKLPKPWDQFDYYPARQAYDDPAAMMQDMLLERVVPGLILKDDSPLAIRNNHGTIQVASLLGGKWDRYKDNPPWIEPWNASDRVEALVNHQTPIDMTGGVVDRSLKTLRSRYPLRSS